MKKYILLLFLLKLTSMNSFSENSDFYWMSSPLDNSFAPISSFEEWRSSPFQTQEWGMSYDFSELFLFGNTLQMIVTPSVEAPNPGLRPGDYGMYGGIGQTPIGDMSLYFVLGVLFYALLIVYKTTKRRTEFNDQ